jgi:O-acetylserine/cysteine efflux transporter
MVVKTVGRVDMLGFMVWTSLFAVPPLLALSLWLEGPQLIATSVVNASAGVWACVLWQAIGNTLFGYGAWNWLLARHPAATVTPMALLVPVFGMGASALSLGEALPAWKLGAGALVLCGLVVIVVWPRLRAAMVKVEAA